MSSWLQEKYIKLCSLPRLIKSGNNYNFRCIICKDSKKKSTKKRGYLLLKNNSYIYYCHNCHIGKEGNGISFDTFLKEYKPELFRDYVKEKIFDKKKDTKETVKNTVKYKNFVSTLKQLNNLNRVIDIKKQDLIIRFLERRKLPSSFIEKLYYTSDFQRYVNENIKKKFESPIPETRIVIPCFNKDKKLIGIQGRNLVGGDNKYITITIIEEEIKLWNVENINNEKDVFIFEGIFDSCFFNNAVSTFGAGFNLDKIKKYINKRVFVFDNDFRYNEKVKDKVIKIIKSGERVVILPKKIKEKDVNQMIINGYTSKEVLKIIKDNIYKRTEAMIKVKL